MSTAPADTDLSNNILPFPQERRAGWRVQDHWERARRDDATPPSLGELDLGHNAALEDVSFLLREDERIEESVFVLCGSALIPAFDLDPVGRSLGDVMPPEILQNIARASEQARVEGRPVTCEGRYERARDGADIRFRSVFMPARSANSGPHGGGYIYGTFGRRDFTERAA